MRINHLAGAMLIVLWSITGHAQAPDPDKVNDLATAISRAEGFGKRHTIPTRYHNPGDLKASRSSTPLEGQVRIGKAGHIVFKDDEAGKAALRNYIVRMMDGRSAHFNPNLTLNQVARRYAKNWRPWVKVVSKELGVPSTTTLRAYFRTDAVPPPALSFRPLPAANREPQPPAVTLPDSRRMLDAVLEIPVNVPPLVEEDAAEHHRLRLFHRAGSDDQPAGTVRVVSSMEESRTTWR
ncbi:MAG TPA: hypothetical protein VMT05_03035 [Terriglobales bacterium]|nr:hypothetical protein [Terriglobales bacterium]